MFDSKRILDFTLPVSDRKEEKAKLRLFFFHQRDYYGYYILDHERKLQKAQVYATAYQGFYDDFERMVLELRECDLSLEEVYFILDFNNLALIPEMYYKAENKQHYYKILVPTASSPQLQAEASEQQKLEIVFNLNEQIKPISILTCSYPDAHIIPSSKGIIEQVQDFDAYVNFSLRKSGLYHTYKKGGKLIEHQYVPLHYEADFLNTILYLVQNHEENPKNIVIVLDGYAEMAAVLEDRLLSMDFRVARVQSSELGDLPEEFSFLPMYTFYNAYVNILCES